MKPGLLDIQSLTSAFILFAISVLHSILLTDIAQILMIQETLLGPIRLAVPKVDHAVPTMMARYISL